MKKSIIIFRLLVSLVVALFPTTAMAEQTGEKNAIYIYRNDGDFNAFLNCDVNDITYSNIDLNGVRHHRAVVQEVHTPDSVYRIPLAACLPYTFVKRMKSMSLSDLAFALIDEFCPELAEDASLDLMTVKAIEDAGDKASREDGADSGK